MIGAAILALLLIVAGIRLLLRKQPTHLTAFAGEAGNVLVSRKAIQELIKQACLLDERVEAVRPVIRFSDSKVHTHVELRLASSENLKASSERVQTRITELLKKSLNFDQIGEIQIVVTSFGNEMSEPEIKQLPPMPIQAPVENLVETESPPAEEAAPTDEKPADEDSPAKGN